MSVSALASALRTLAFSKISFMVFFIGSYKVTTSPEEDTEFILEERLSISALYFSNWEFKFASNCNFKFVICGSIASESSLTFSCNWPELFISVKGFESFENSFNVKDLSSARDANFWKLSIIFDS